MGTLTTNMISNTAGTVVAPVNELYGRVVQRFENTYTAGEWNPDTNYNWAPGSFVDFTPRYADSRISYIWRCPHAWSNAAHAISHWHFFVNGYLYYFHSTSGVHIEDGCVVKWDFPSWGTTAGRIGYQIRSYTNDSNELRFYRTFYWDGLSSVQNARGQLIVEEYMGTGSPVRNQDGTWIVG